MSILLGEFTDTVQLSYIKFSSHTFQAFAAVSLLEYRKFKAGENVSYSEQNLVDCSSLNYGCGGGWPTFALIYIRDYGISDGRKYLYKNAKQDCQRNATQYPPVMNVTDVCEVIVNGKEDLMVKLIAQYGPVSGALSIFLKFFQKNLVRKICFSDN